MKSQGNKIRLVCYDHNTVVYKQKFEEANSHVILGQSFAVDNIAGLYRTFKIENNETAISQA